jgi:hypothetical protein
VCSTRLCEVPRSARDDTGVFLREISRPSMSAKEHTFTLSIEEEFAIVDPATREHTARFPKSFRKCEVWNRRQ